MKKIALMLSICLILFLIGCQKSDPIKTVNNYLALWQQQKYEDMYKMLPSRILSSIEQYEFVSAYQEWSSNIKLIDFEITDEQPQKQNDNTLVHFTAKFSAGDVLEFEQEYAVPIVLEDREWKIDWHYGLIFPGLNQGDKIKTVIGDPPKRGTIHDRFDNILATDGQAYTVGAVPQAIPDEKQFAKKLSSILELSEDYILKQLNQEWVKADSFVPLRHLPLNISEDYKQKILSVKGVMLSKNQKTARNYPDADLFCHILGYVQSLTAEELKEKAQQGYTASDVIGKQGIESAMEKTLAGSKQYAVVIQHSNNSQDDQVIAKKEEIQGSDIALTINSYIQSIAYDALGEFKGSIVVLQPKTGEVLAMVSKPCYDPNLFAAGMLPSTWEKLSQDPDNPFLNRTIKALYPPGSTFKPFTAAMALNQGTISPDTVVEQAQNEEWKPSDDWGNHSIKRIPHPAGEVNLRNALIWSDNIYFAWTALKLGQDNFERYSTDYGMNEAVPFTLSVSPAQIKRDDTVWSEQLLADSAYGQGEMLITPLQLAAMYTAFSNDGSMLKPQIIKEIRNGEQTQTFKQEIWKKDVIPSDIANTILNYMIDVVQDDTGTAHKLYIPNLTIAAKTGTAQIGSDSQNEIGWLVAFTIDNQNPILVCISLETQAGQGISKIDIAKQIFERYYDI